MLLQNITIPKKKTNWKYYNHAVIPTTEPHEIPDMTPLTNGTIWKIGGGVSAISQMDF